MTAGEEEGGTGEFGGIAGGREESGGTAGSPSRGQLRGRPGDPGEDRLGVPLGASGTAGFDSSPGTQGGFVRGRLSPLAVPAPPQHRQGASGRDEELRRLLEEERRDVQPEEDDPLSFSRRPRLELPAGPEPPGPPGGLTLDAAIDLLVRQNLDLMALRYEIPKAEADILTAGLRNNPIIYADSQFVPYGHYTNERPGGGGGQPQYDVNVSFPLDVSRKRAARVEVARRARSVTEAQFQDTVRTLIDDLYTAYVNVLAARETLRYSEAFQQGITRLLDRAEGDRSRAGLDQREAEDRHGEGSEEARRAAEASRAAEFAVDMLRDHARQSHFEVRRAAQVLARSRRSLAQLLGIPAAGAESLELLGSLREIRPLPAPAGDLVRTALASRPDLIAYRLGTDRARADVRLARANRLSDIYLIYQPYTFQDNRAFGLKGTYSWAVGVNAALPVFNRNQGNIARAEWNARQTEVELAALEHRVVHEVEEAIRSFELSQAGLIELERDVLPAARKDRDDGYEEYREDPEKVDRYVDRQTNYNEVVQQYRNALIEHRQSMLWINTAVGSRVLP